MPSQGIGGGSEGEDNTKVLLNVSGVLEYICFFINACLLFLLGECYAVLIFLEEV